MAEQSPLDFDFVRRVIDAALPEDQELEYKRELPKKITDPTRAAQSKADPFEEFAKDVSAMANASGGVLLYGVAEDDKTKRPATYPITDEPFDQAQVRLHSILDGLIEPRLMGVTFDEIRIHGGYVLGIRVPGSLAGPHWHGKPERRRFSVRRGGRVSEYTYQELRAAFDRNASAAALARQWIEKRVAAIKAGQTWRSLLPGPMTVVHIVPMLSYYQETPPIEIRQASELAIKFPRPWMQGGYSDSINFDGYMIYQSGGEEDTELFGYTQMFRNGTMEVVRSAGSVWSTDTSEDLVGAGPIAWTVHDAVTLGPSVIRAIGRDGPLLIGISVIGTLGYALPAYGRPDHRRHVSDRDALVVPAVYIEQTDSDVELNRVAKTALDMIWQGFGYRSCPHYDQHGKYIEEV
jgi:hypothetical protein